MQLIKLFNFLFISCLVIPIKGQQFTKITAGVIANDEGLSLGVAWGDLNNDGYSDLFVSNGGADGINADNFLYINNGNGEFTKITNGDIVAGNKKSNGATIGDFNNDRLLDIAVANRDNQNNFLYINNGNLEFTKVLDGNIVNDGGNSNASSWTDYNNDGKLDLYFTNFFTESLLYKNIDGQSFVGIIGENPVKESNTSISSSWSDYDNDGDLDLYVCNAASAGKQNLFYRNNGDESFTKIITGKLVQDKRASMGSSWGDYNNDGFLDLFVANQASFVNDLYTNNGDGSFTAVDSGDVVSENSMSITGCFVDYDNDGDLDLFVTNWSYNKNFLYANSGYPEYSFSKIDTGTIVSESENSMGAGWADYDNDGDLDLFIANRDNQNNSFYRNNQKEKNWFEINLLGIQSNSVAIGTKIRIKANIKGQSIWQMREVNAQYGYNSQDDNRVHFGIDLATVIDSVIIEWPSGLNQIFQNVEPNKIYKLEENGQLDLLLTSVKSNINKNSIKINLKQNYPNPFNPYTKIKYSIKEKGFVNLQVYNILGEHIMTLVDKYQKPGNYNVTFNGKNIASGIYIYRLNIKEFSSTRKMVILK